MRKDCIFADAADNVTLPTSSCQGPFAVLSSNHTIVLHKCAATLLVAGVVLGSTGCATDEKQQQAPPKAATVQQFCTAYATQFDTQTSKDWAENMLAVGLPAGLTKAEKTGFEETIAIAKGENQDPLASDGPDAQQHSDNVEAFFTYGLRECKNELDAARAKNKTTSSPSPTISN